MKNREYVIKAQEIITDVLVDYIKAMCKTGVHAIVLDTLFASQCIMSKNLWRRNRVSLCQDTGRYHPGMRLHGHGS